MNEAGAEGAGAEAGFSLVEMLVVLALVSALSATIVMATGQFGALLRIDRNLETRLALQRTAGHVAGLVEGAEDVAVSRQAQPQQPQPQPGEGQVEGQPAPARGIFKGTSKELRFVATARRGAYSSGFRDITIRLDGAGGAKRLVQDMAPARPGDRSPEIIETIELARDVTDLTFAYFGAQGEQRAPLWQASWSDPARLPLAVSVQISVRKGDAAFAATDIATLGSP